MIEHLTEHVKVVYLSHSPRLHSHEANDFQKKKLNVKNTEYFSFSVRSAGTSRQRVRGNEELTFRSINWISNAVALRPASISKVKLSKSRNENFIRLLRRVKGGHLRSITENHADHREITTLDNLTQLDFVDLLNFFFFFAPQSHSELDWSLKQASPAHVSI